MARRRAWLGWSSRRRPLRTSRSSTNPTEPTARSPGPISHSTLSATVTPAPRAKSWSNSDAPTPFPEAASQPRAQDSIAPANWIATSANSKPSAVRTLLPARSRGICMKMLATWPVRTPQLQNTWRPVAVGRKSRYCSPVSSGSCASRLRGPNGVRDEFLLAATAQNLRRLARLRPVNMLPETTRHITPPSAADEPPKRPWPILLEILHASHQSEYLTAFFNGICAKPTARVDV